MGGTPAPPFHFPVLRAPGSIAGICWALGFLFQNAAVIRAGNATMMPANLSIQIITSGAWSVVYYREIGGWHAVVWGMAAVWTLGFMILLADEKAGS